MLLRESGAATESTYELKGITERALDTGVENEHVLLAFSDAIWGTDRAALDRARDDLHQLMGPGAVVEASITAANFGMVDRIAKAIGIPLDHMAHEPTRDFRAALGIDRFLSARNTSFNKA